MTTRYTRKKLRTPLRVHVRRLLRAGFLLLILGLIPLFLWLQTQDPAAYRFNGLVESESETVGPVDAARILAIDVQPGQRVAAGDVLVRLGPPVGKTCSRNRRSERRGGPSRPEGRLADLKPR